jgi:Xaa-Pro dipeptidase
MASPHSPETLKARQAKLAALLPELKLDALALNAGPSLSYFTGLPFHLMERPAVALFSADQPPALVLPELELGKTRGLAYPLETFAYSEDLSQWSAAFGKAAAHIGTDAAKIGVEPTQARVLELRYLEAAFPQAEFVDGSAAVARLRRIKDAGEVAAMQRAAEIAEAALSATLPQIKLGMTERQIAGLLVTEILKSGSDTHLPFAPIVASGPNSANPHAAPGDRQLQAGDLLLFDWGASMDGYFSDITRTFAVGAISDELKRIYEVVKLANQAGREAGKPGAAAAAVDIAARDAIEDNGYGEYFIHRTGHGLGMEPHEEPWIRGDNQAKLEEGMAFTVEPGIYLPDKGGVRIEDNVVVTADGLKSLTTFPRELQVLGV